jgi:uncharacterized protein
LAGKRIEQELVQGFLHEPAGKPSGDGLAITHGAGSNCEAPLLVAVAEAFAGAGFYVLRFDLPYRQQGRSSPPLPAHQGKDREGIRRAVDALREVLGAGRAFLGGHSYGGRQSTMLAAEDRSVADALLLLSYPLHPPRKPEQLRTAHFPNLRTPAFFMHGTRDPFGSIPEMQAAMAAIPARTELIEVAGAPHGLSPAIAPGLPHQFSGFLAR